MTAAPCKDCHDRRLHCHSSCKRYIEYLIIHNQERERIQTERSSEVTSYNRESAAKVMGAEHRRGHKRQK